MELEFLTSDSPHRASALALYRAAFPWQERRETPDWLPDNIAFRPGILTEAGAFLGILFYWEGPDFLYLEHFAILPQDRNRGLGAQALALLQSRGKPIILEIEPPVDALTCRRKGFYRRNGFAPNPWPHIQPKYRPEDAPFPLELLSWPGSISQTQWQAFERFLDANVGIPLPDNA